MDRETRNAKRRSIGPRQEISAGNSGVERRSSKKSNSEDRHGKIYPDNFRETTIRTVTPDLGPMDDSLSEQEAVNSPAATSPSSPSNGPGSQSDRPAQYAHSLPNTDEERSSVDAKRKPHKSKSKGGDSASTSSASPSLFSKTRNRLGSITASSLPQRPSEEGAGSIGFPSIHSPPLTIQTDGRSKLLKTRASATSPPLQPYMEEQPLRSPTANSDSNKILALMNTTCGRMHGILSFRVSGSSTWSTGYCAINVASGSLICQVKGEITSAKTLIPDLRGCSVRTFVDPDSQNMFLSVWTASSGLGIQLKPQVPETFDSWLAALLCWQPIRPKGVQNKMTKPQSPAVLERKDRRRASESSATPSQRNAAIIKVGKMLLWEGYSTNDVPTHPPVRRGSTFKLNPEPFSSNWQRVSCTLHENGHFKLLTEGDAQIITFIPLSQLSRCAIQQLDPSVLGEEFCMALYPQYGTNWGPQMPPKPVFLCLESRVLYEVWFVLLRAFTIPELYGPQLSVDPPEGNGNIVQKTTQDIAAKGMFRVERVLSIRVTEAKIKASTIASPTLKRHGIRGEGDESIGDYYSEIHLDGEIRARTAIKNKTNKPFWREEFNFIDLPPVLSSASLLIKTKNSAEKEWTMVTRENYAMNYPDSTTPPVTGNIEVAMHDSTCGKVELQLDELEHGQEVEKWWPIYDGNEQVVGDVLMRVRLDETIVLMTKDYSALSGLLHNFSKGLTVRISKELSTEAKQLSEIFLDIFQVSTHVGEWIMALVEDEIDSSEKESGLNRLRYGGRIYSNDSDSGPERDVREMVLRDLGKSAATEANLLFRGNTILTRAFDAHMRRLGKEYLMETIGERLREIDDGNIDCEVDPNRVSSPEELKRNWRTLITLTTGMWKSISASASRCPPELRILFRHVRSCAEDRYGDFLRTVSYSSVSGFLFLRFFCPAILNPKLFGLLKNHPQPRANRTLTLVAKSLQTLANMTQFGGKEPWMEPMNKFLLAARGEFKTFVDQVCYNTTERPSQALSPSYATPIQILGRLPPTSREGFPSLPFLIDSARNFAALVTLWLSKSSQESISRLPEDDPLAKFHQLCTELQKRTDECLAKAEQAERPTGGMQSRWEQVLEDRERQSTLYDETNIPDTPSAEGTTMTFPYHLRNNRESFVPFARPFSPQQSSGAAEEDPEDTPPSSASFTWDQSRIPFSGHDRPSETRGSTSSSKNSSTVSFDPLENGRTRPPQPLRQDSGGKRGFLDFGSRSTRRKGKDRDGSTTPRDESRNEFI